MAVYIPIAKYMLRPIFSGMNSCLHQNLRKRLSAWIFRQSYLPGRFWLAQQCLEDLLTTNPNEYHKFLWNNHLYYAETCEIAQRFGVEFQKESRRIFFEQLLDHLQNMGFASEQVHSIFEVGCSLGYQLRYMETDLFTSANRVKGLDIDEYAIKKGKTFLRSLGSQIELECGDMEYLDFFMGSEDYDVIICTGTLMYLDQESAGAVVDSMLRHTKTILGLVGMAHPSHPNCQMVHSCTRAMDLSYYHDFESMVTRTGGTVIGTMWEPDTAPDGLGTYIVFATPSQAAEGNFDSKPQ